ncbi:MAG: hypothetical protein EXS08_09120 [Planctomycetes bacterium]|nr:hypothetical protein [Planctomycetota bacterium]
MNTRFLALSLLSLSSLLPAQQVQPVLRVNDLIGGEPVKGLLRAVVADDGVWQAVVLKNIPTHFENAELLRDGVPVAAEGDLLANGEHLSAIYALEGGGDNVCLLAYLESFGGVTFSGSALVRGDRVVLEGGQPPAVVGLPASTVCNKIETLAANENDSALVSARLNGNPADRALILFRFDASGASVVRQLLLRVGDVLADGAVVADFARAALNENGDWLVRLTTTTGQDRLLGGTREYLRSGAPSPIPGRSVAQILRTYALNDLGGFATAALLSGDPATDAVLLVNGAIAAQEGDALPPAQPTVAGGILSAIGQALLTNSGNVYWQGLVGPGNQSRGSFLRDGALILQAQVSQVGGELVTGFADVKDNFDVSPSGRFWIGRIELQISGDAYVLADFGAAVPLSGCVPNPATLRVTGGLALVGHTVDLALDGPLELGASALVHLSLGAARPGQACGLPTPFGELLISPAQHVGAIAAGSFAGVPLPTQLAIPSSAALVDLELFAQAAFAQPTRGLVLSNAIAFEIGAP